MTTTPVITQGIAGPFTVTAAPLTFSGGTGTVGSAATIGIIGGRGIREIRRYQNEEVTADLLGGAVVDDVHLNSTLFLEFELEEANYLEVMRLCQPYQETAITDLASILAKEGELGTPGQYGSTRTSQLVLTPSSTTLHSAGAQATPTRIYGLVKIAPNFELTKLLASRRRVVPLRLQCFPYLVSSKYVFYTKS